MRSTTLSACCALILITLLTGCTGLFSSVFGQDDPALLAAAGAVTARYGLPFPPGRRFLLAQGVGGSFSHTGASAWSLDFAMPIGTPVHAARDGIVRQVRTEASDRDLPLEMREANFVSIAHGDGELSVYAHLDSAHVRPGQAVRRGEWIASSGNTGYSTQPHLHIHVEKDGRTIPFAFDDLPGGIPRVGRFYP